MIKSAEDIAEGLSDWDMSTVRHYFGPKYLSRLRKPDIQI